MQIDISNFKNIETKKDLLTGTLHKEKLELLYYCQLQISFATSEPFILALCNLDYFKYVNDTFGFEAGDKMLENFLPIAKKSLRGSDIIFRDGADEFVFILPAIKIEKAKDILNKIRQDFDHFVLEFDGKMISTTLSMGVIEIDPSNVYEKCKKFENCISEVKNILLQAKNDGKNRIY